MFFIICINSVNIFLHYIAKKNSIDINEHLRISYHYFNLHFKCILSKLFYLIIMYFFEASPMDYVELYACQMRHFFTTEYSKKTWEFVKGKGLLSFHKTLIDQMLTWNSCKINCNRCHFTCPLFAIISRFLLYNFVIYCHF